MCRAKSEVFILTNSHLDDFARIEREVNLLMRRAQTLRTADPFAKRLDRAGYLILTLLDERGSLRIRAVANALGLDISTASRQVSALLEKGLIEGEACVTDGRATELRLSSAGKMLLGQVQDARHVLYRRILKGWNASDLAAFSMLLGKFNDDLRQFRKWREDTSWNGSTELDEETLN